MRSTHDSQILCHQTLPSHACSMPPYRKSPIKAALGLYQQHTEQGTILETSGLFLAYAASARIGNNTLTVRHVRVVLGIHR